MKPLMILIVMAALSSVTFGASACTELNNSAITRETSTEELVSFLSTQRALQSSSRDAECVTAAIHYLEYKPAPEVIKLLIQYLDFKRPLSDAEQHGVLLHAPSISGDYPATGTLMTFGKQIAPILVDTIKNSASSRSRQNATYTLVGLFRGEPEQALQLLKQELPTSDQHGADRLLAAAKEAVQWCGLQHKQSCEAVLKQPELK